MLFSTIELIFDGNTELLDKLKAVSLQFFCFEVLQEVSKPEPMIGAIFLSLADQLCQYYGVFCNHQKDAMDSIGTLNTVRVTIIGLKCMLEFGRVQEFSGFL
jgi:hypothetical protein